MVGVFDVAEYVLSEVGYVSTMKLQKLVFYSQAYSLAVLDEPLFSDDFGALINGPRVSFFVSGSQGFVCRR